MKMAADPIIPKVERVWSPNDRFGSRRDQAGSPRIESLEALARIMDAAFEVPGLGIRFGLDALIGLLPGIGDTLSAVISMYLLKAASQLGVPRVTLMRMGLNVATDALLGSVPLIGDIFDVGWKANVKNVELLKRHLETTPVDQRRARRGDWLVVGAVGVVVAAAVIGAATVAFLLIAALTRFVFG
jgi:hypothetical protein